MVRGAEWTSPAETIGSIDRFHVGALTGRLRNVRLTPQEQSRAASELVSANPTADIAVVYSPPPERTIGWGVTFGGKDLKAQCPNEPNIIVAMSSTETRKGEVGVSKFIPTHLICPFFDEPLFA